MNTVRLLIDDVSLVSGQVPPERFRAASSQNAQISAPATRSEWILRQLDRALAVSLPALLGLTLDGLLAGSLSILWLLVLQQLTHCAVILVRSPARASAPPEDSIIPTFSMERLFWAACVPLLLLGWYDWHLLPLCLTLIPPALLLHAALRGRAHWLVTHHGFSHRDAPRLEAMSTISVTVMRLFSLLVLAAALVQLSGQSHATPGVYVAVVSYLCLFVNGMRRLVG